jgi:hypothetical protein
VQGNTTYYGSTSGGAFSAICILQIPELTASKPAKLAGASDGKIARHLTILIIRYFRRQKTRTMKHHAKRGGKGFSRKPKRPAFPSGRDQRGWS